MAGPCRIIFADILSKAPCGGLDDAAQPQSDVRPLQHEGRQRDGSTDALIPGEDDVGEQHVDATVQGLVTDV